MKNKPHLTRKNLIAVALVFFYGIMVLLAALAIDGNNPMFAKNNPIQELARSLFVLETLDGRIVNGVPVGSFPAYVLVLLFAVYLVVAVSAVLFEYRLAKYYDEKPNSKKWIITYVVTILVSSALWIGISMISQIGDQPFPYYIGTSFLFLLESIVLGALLYLVIGSVIFNVAVLVINVKNIDKPYRFFDNSTAETKAELEALEEEHRALQQGELAASFGEGNPVSGNGGAGGTSSATLSAEESGSPLKEKSRVFPGLVSIDDECATPERAIPCDELSLSEIAVRFRNYLAAEEGLYFSLRVIREFLAGLSASRLIILEGLSGTGKSSLARYFSEFISEKSYFEAVQATWRDRTSILGYYNDFSKSYSETEFLKRLYKASYRKDAINIMVLDEINISRVEYYFADFLSVLEYPEDEWKIKIMQFPYDFDAPLHLQDGILQIPANTYFIGTANKDESTFVITDKVYDRAISIDFDDRNEPFVPEGESSKITLTYSRLQELFASAYEKEDNLLSEKDYKKFKTLTDYTYEVFDLTFGNRILRQIEKFVPVFVELGGTKEDALDFLFARKVIAKLEGRFEDYIRQGLLDLKSLILSTYGEGSFPETSHLIDKFVKKL